MQLSQRTFHKPQNAGYDERARGGGTTVRPSGPGDRGFGGTGVNRVGDTNRQRPAPQTPLPSLSGQPKPITPVGAGYGPLDSPEDLYRYMQYNRFGNAHHTSPLRSLLPLHFFDNTAGQVGTAQLANTLRNPYATPDAQRRQSLEGAEQAYQVANQRIRTDTLGSGAGRGGVARGLRGQVEQARGADMAREMREHEQFVTNLGDRRLQSLLIPYLNSYNSAYGATLGQPPEEGNNDLGDIAALISAFAGFAS